MVNAKKDVVWQETDLGWTPWESSGAHITLQLSSTLGQGFGFCIPSYFLTAVVWSRSRADGGRSLSDDLPWVPLRRRHRAGGHSSGCSEGHSGWVLSVEKHHHVKSAWIQNVWLLVCYVPRLPSLNSGDHAFSQNFTEFSMVSGTLYTTSNFMLA